jgi:hypothetical protein
VPTLKQAGSAVWTAATLTNLNQLTNPGFITSSALSPYAPLVSPTLTGTPAAPTAAVDTSTTQLATTAFVINQSYLKASTAASTYAALTGATFTGDINLQRSGAPTTGALFFTNVGGRYLFHDNTQFNLVGGALAVAAAVSASSFSGAGTGLTGTASGLTSGAASSVAWAGITGAPAITGLTASTGVAANTVVQRDSSGSIFASYVQASTASAGSGYMFLNAGDTTHTGYLAWSDKNGVRQGYLGYSTSLGSVDSGTINMVCGTLSLSGSLTSSGAMTASSFSGAGTGLTGTAASLTAGAANSVAWANVSGVPTITSLTANQSTSNNTVVQRDSNGAMQASVVTAVSGAVGYARLNSGFGAYTGYLEFVASNGNRQGYIGFSNNSGATDTGTIVMTCGSFAVTGGLTVRGNTAFAGYIQSGGAPSGGNDNEVFLIY